MPPVSFSELFGAEEQSNADAQGFQRQESIFGNDNIDEELKDFDPMEELLTMRNQDDKSMDPQLRKSVWKMNYQMKNELTAKSQKAKLIEEHLL